MIPCTFPFFLLRFSCLSTPRTAVVPLPTGKMPGSWAAGTGRSAPAPAGALILGFVTGGLIEGVAGCALWSLCDFGEAVLTSEIDTALTLQLRYSYHVREPARMYDYYMSSL